MIKLIFPEVKGSNLEKKKYTIPQDLEGAINIVTVAFQQWHQSLVNTWVPFLEELKQKYPQVQFYEFPTIKRGYRGMSFMIDGGMRAGIPDKTIRSRTITLYIDKKKFMKNLEIENDQNIHTFVLNSKGEIIHREEGRYSSESSIRIAKKVTDLIEK